MRSYNLNLSDLAYAILLWALLIMHYGYTYGTNDHVELLPYVLYLKNPSLFQHDLFIQGLHASLPNERSVMAYLLLPFAAHLRISIFLLHFICTILKVLALVKLAGRFIANRYFSWLAVFLSVFIFNNKGLGDIDLYSSAIQASDVSCTILIWAIHLFLDRKYLFAATVTAAATFVHILEGLDVMLVLSAVLFLLWCLDAEVSIRKLGAFYALYALSAGVYLLFIYKAKTAGATGLSKEEIFQIMFAFRHPHHFLFRTFPLFNKVLFFILLGSALLYFKARSRALYYFLIIGTVGLLFYIVCVDCFHIVDIANFQWYKVAQWIKFFGFTAVAGWLFNLSGSFYYKENRSFNGIIKLCSVVVLGLITWQYRAGTFNFGYKQGNENEIVLCRHLQKLSNENSVFVQPFNMTALKFYGLRSAYVEFKAIAKNQRDLKTWYERIQEVYGLDYHTDREGFKMESKADKYIDAMSEAQLMRLKGEGVTHLICFTERYKDRHKLILSENGYYVYVL